MPSVIDMNDEDMLANDFRIMNMNLPSNNGVIQVINTILLSTE